MENGIRGMVRLSSTTIAFFERKPRMPYKHLTISEREIISNMHSAGKSQADIARELNRPAPPARFLGNSNEMSTREASTLPARLNAKPTDKERRANFPGNSTMDP